MTRITADQAAMILGVPLRTVQQMAAAGCLPGAVKIGKRWTFDPAKLSAWLGENETWRPSAPRPRATEGYLRFLTPEQAKKAKQMG